MRVGIYRKRDFTMPDSVALNKCFKSIQEIVRDVNASILIDEKIDFLGFQARKLKLYLPGPNPCYASMILFVRGLLLVELATLDVAIPDNIDRAWKENTFFQSVSLADPTPDLFIQQYGRGITACSILPCYFNDQKILAYFPGALLIKQAKMEPDINVTKYQVAPYDMKGTLFYSIELYESSRGLHYFSDSTYIEMAMKLGHIESMFNRKEKVISFEKRPYKGKHAIYMHTALTLPPNSDSITDIHLYSRMFIHNGRLVRMFTYRRAGDPEDATETCFWDQAVFLE
jgi:hypothetical protein